MKPQGPAQDASLFDLGRRVAAQHPLRRISPEPLQIVELAGLLVENMNDHILVVKQNPARLAGPLAVPHAHACQRQALFHAFGEGPDLARGERAGDHEIVGEVGQAP